MAHLKTVNKIREYLKMQTEFVTPSKIVVDCHIKFIIVRECLKFLEELNLIETLSNGKVTFVKSKEKQ